ncbi:MAG TPA: serine hydrolase domain-containing protein [Bacteroidales bacterium]|nr:serine hydrolase domain-containing protein [Bacteroidales bacterium]
MKIISSFLITLAISSIAFGNDSKENLAVTRLQQIMKENKAVGLAVAVVKDGKMVYVGSFGKKNIENDVDLKKDDLFRIASISKSFTTTALMTLVDKGLVDINQDVSELIGFKVRNPKFPDIPITLKMLLSHTSSLRDAAGYFTLDVVNPEKNEKYGEAYHDYAPGTAYDYCNLGFNIIGTIVERVSGKRFDDYVRNSVIRPLGLYADYNVDSLDTSKFVTLYGNDDNGIWGARPEAYMSRGDEIKNNYVFGYSTPIFSPTGGIKISAQDLARYMIMHMNYGKYGKVRVISEKSSRMMQTPVVKVDDFTEYCMALEKVTNLIPGEVMTGHTGSAYGVYSAMFFNPDKRFGIVMMTNGCPPVYKDGFTVIQGEVIRALYNIFIAK